MGFVTPDDHSMAVAQGNGHYRNRDPGGLLAYALVASILAHALIFLVAPGWVDKAKRKAGTPPSLVARLVQSAPAAAPMEEPRQRAAVQPEAARRPRLAERVEPKLTAPSAPSTVPAAAPPAPVTDSPRAPEIDRPAAPVSVAPPITRLEPAAVAAPPLAAPPAADAADPATLGQYRIAIVSAARRYKRYPRIALDNNWEGRAEIRMVIGVDGNVASISIKSRSGFDVLDQQALEMIRKAKPLAPIPPALRGKGFTIDVPVVFSLKEETG